MKKNSNFSRGFTLIELIIVVAIIAILSGLILFSVTQYINKGKDSNISGNLSVLIPAGEVFYDGNSNSYTGFCDLGVNGNSVLKNAIIQMPQNLNGDCTDNVAGICCYAVSQVWAACAQEFVDTSKAYCVDSRGMKEEIDNSSCTSSGIIINGVAGGQCP